MSAIRSLRQFAVSSRVLSTRACTRSCLGSRLSSQAAPRAVTSFPVSRSFSLSSRVLGEGSTDLSLSQKLVEELKFEQDVNKSGKKQPDFLKAFEANGIWKVEDIEGNDEVTLTRKFGNETIKLMFSISDLHQNPDEEFEDEDGEVDNEPLPNTSPLRCSIAITKSSSPGSLGIESLCQEGSFILDSISYYPDKKIGTELTPEADWKRRGLYVGPQFDTLDIRVQEEFEKFLNERGINEGLAHFIPEYCEHKEQKEYMRWLEGVKSFVSQ